jgi:DNA-binding winged helix-turn-helix (wHTH) protein
VGSTNLRLRFGNCLFDSETRELARAGAAAHLSPKGFQLLEALLERRPKAISRRQLHRILWPDTFVAETTLNSVVAEVRAAIGDGAKRSRLVRTVPVFGYAFCGEAKEAPPAPGRPPGPGCRVTWAGRSWDLAEGENVLGRGPEAAVTVDDETVSRRHALVRVAADGTATLEDLGSKNGTFLRGRLLTARTPLEDGEEFVLGEVALQFRSLRGAASTRSARRKLRATGRGR